jgi:ribosome-binding protein aMBF1 (putative translation factor)
MTEKRTRDRHLTPEEASRYEEIRRQVEQDRPELIAEARDVAERFRALGAMLRAEREAAGLTLRELSERSGMDKGFLSRLENGHRSPTYDTLRRYAEALGKEIDVRIVDAA